METIAKIRRLHHVQNKGIKTIARELRLSKNTVRKVLRSDATQHTYQRSIQPYKVLGAYKEVLASKLSADKIEPVRRRRTAKKLYLEIRELGYTGSYEAVNNFVKSWKQARDALSSQIYVPLAFSAGEAFQFDWSEEEIELGGKLTRIKVAQIRLCYSRHFLLVAYLNEQLEMVLDAHDRAFAFFGGNPRQGTYDNMKTAVKQILPGKAREFNVRLEELASHYLFELVACTPRSGWEKGQVENQVLTTRRNFFTPLVRVADLDTLNEQLTQFCLQWAKQTSHPEIKEQTVWAVYQQEKCSLLPERAAFNGYKLIPATVSSTSLVHFDTNVYSVDCHYVHKAVELRISAERIMVHHQDTCIAEHRRHFGRHQKVYNPWHYVPVLERKPGALRHGAPFKDWQLPMPLVKVRKALAQHADGDKQFIELLLQVKIWGLEAVSQACRQAICQGISQASYIIACLEKKQHNTANPTQCVMAIPLAHPVSSDCRMYNQLYQQSIYQGGAHDAA